MKTSTEAAKSFKTELKSAFIRAALSAACLYGATYPLVQSDTRHEHHALKTAAIKAGHRFDTTLKPLLASDKAVSISAIDKADKNLANCLLRQNPTRVTILQNGTLTSSGTLQVQPRRLRDCYLDRARSDAEKTYIAQNGLKDGAIFGSGLAVIGLGLAALGSFGAAGISGIQYVSRRRQEKTQATASPASPNL